MVSRILLEYDGTHFAGWARQPGRRTVQAEIERALTTLLREQATLTVGGRTDRGVHAWGQVASYAGAPVGAHRLNALTPHDIAILGCERAADGFDARRDATSRTYCFRLLARREPSAFEHGRALHHPHRLDRDALHACAALLPGTHDFTAFTPTETGHIRFTRRVLAAEWRDHGELLEFWITADAFMRHMNRVLMGTMLEVATGRRTLDSFAGLLEGRPRAEAGRTAAPHGLYLARIAYPERA